MSLTINKERLLIALPALAVLMGVVLENGIPEYNSNLQDGNTKLPDLGCFAKSLFVIGWIGIAYMISRKSDGTVDFSDKKSMFAILGSIGIVSVVMAMKHFMQKKQNDNVELPKYFPVLAIVFASCWLLVGHSSAMGNNSRFGMNIGMLAAVCVIAAMLFFLPKMQKDQKVVYGPGMALFGIGLSMLTVSNGITA
jgi:hypothetical protein